MATIFEKGLDGTFHVSVSPLRDANGSVWGSVLVARPAGPNAPAEARPTP
jgi:hypothetical protein